MDEELLLDIYNKFGPKDYDPPKEEKLAIAREIVEHAKR